MHTHTHTPPHGIQIGVHTQRTVDKRKVSIHGRSLPCANLCGSVRPLPVVVVYEKYSGTVPEKQYENVVVSMCHVYSAVPEPRPGQEPCRVVFGNQTNSDSSAGSQPLMSHSGSLLQDLPSKHDAYDVGESQGEHRTAVRSDHHKSSALLQR